MTTRFFWFSQITKSDQPEVGSKAARLSAMYLAGFPVPSGFCIPVGVYRTWALSMDESLLLDLVRARNFAAIHDYILRLPLHPDLTGPLLQQYRMLQPVAPHGVAVRSSSTAEDLQGYSFAGLYESILAVSDETAFLEAVRTCWASFWSDEAAVYREQAGLDHLAHGMAVLVQAMVQPVATGVMFTQAYPDDENVAVIEFVRGKGDPLMSGEARGESILVSKRSGNIYNIPIQGGELDLSRLLSLGGALERHQGRPQDIEWAMDEGGEIWLLQTRPITVYPKRRLDSTAEVDEGWLITYDEPFSPLGCQIAIQRYHQWVRAINRIFKTSFKAEMRNLDGLLYYRPLWRTASLPLEIWMRFWQLISWIGAERIYRKYVQKTYPEFEGILTELDQYDLGKLDQRKLLEGFNRAIEIYLDYQYSSYAIGSMATLSASLLDRLCLQVLGIEDKWNALDFLTGLDDVSVRRGLEMERLAVSLMQARSTDEILALDLSRLLARESEGEPATEELRQLQEFLMEFGYVWADRYPRDPAWQLNTEAVELSLTFAASQAIGENSFNSRHARQQIRRREVIGQALQHLRTSSRIPFRTQLFNFMLRRAEKYFPHKEERNHQTYKAVAVIRRYAQEIGRRLAVRRMIEKEEDIFFLLIEEIKRLLSATKPESRLLKQIGTRKEIYLRTLSRVQRREEPWDATNRRSQPGASSFELRGETCSPGLARGPARLVSGLGELQRVKPGEIMVCTQLRPAWSSVFARAGGVVIEMGSLLSHGSTLAREYGIPVVINVAGITDKVHENDWLIVDGNLGRVVVEPRPAALEERKWEFLARQPG